MASSAAPSTSLGENDVQAINNLRSTYSRLRDELRRVIVGQESVIEQLAICLFARGHALLMGVPGLAKTLLVSKLAETMSLKFNRIQFTPDLMPSDITGTDIIQEDTTTGRRQMVFAPGPIFANIVLADEINRTPPKTQAALLEAMQEHRVTIQGRTYTLNEPFFVFATQNPIELEGTYPLPEAQLDRFMFNIRMEHPPEEEELEVVRATTKIIDPQFNRTVSGPDLVAFQRLVRRVPIADPVLKYALTLVRTSRPKSPQAPGSSIRLYSRVSATSNCSRATWSMDSSTACTVPRSSALPSTLPSIAGTCPATTSGVSTGGSTRGPTATT